MLSIYLLPVGSARFELYSEPPDEKPSIEPHDGVFKRSFHRLGEHWRETVHTARRRDPAAGRLKQWRDWSVCRVAEMIAEQRTLWAIRHEPAARFVYPSDMPEATAQARRDLMLTGARRHHGIWMILDGILFVASGVFMLVPGPNVLAYYFGARAVGHYLSWCGARQALDGLQWDVRPEPALAELGRLVDVSREARASRVKAIADALNLPRLVVFFDRTALPAR
jgi:Mitochondrial K+-H+ exchange-related